ncbi:MAG TPA: hypothetical protein VJK04_00475, partial [Candidatus Paceibacterota bacterium]
MQRQVRRPIPCAIPRNKFKRLGEGVSRLPGPGRRLRLGLCLILESEVHEVAGIPTAGIEEVLGDHALSAYAVSRTPAVLNNQSFLALVEREVNGADRVPACCRR